MIWKVCKAPGLKDAPTTSAGTPVDEVLQALQEQEIPQGSCTTQHPKSPYRSLLVQDRALRQPSNFLWWSASQHVERTKAGSCKPDSKGKGRYALHTVADSSLRRRHELAKDLSPVELNSTGGDPTGCERRKVHYTPTRVASSLAERPGEIPLWLQERNTYCIG